MRKTTAAPPENLFDIAVVGAGIPGLVMALLAARSGWRVAIIDKGTAPLAAHTSRRTGRTVALMTPSLELLGRVLPANIWQPLGTRLETLQIIEDSLYPAETHPPRTARFEARELGLDVFGYAFPIPAVQAALSEAARQHNLVTCLHGAGLATWVKEGHLAHLTLTNGETIRAALVVGADGRDSAVRAAAGIKAHIRPYGQTALTCLIGHTGSHNNTSTEFHRTGGPFTLVPATDNTSAIVWVEPEAEAQAALVWPKTTLVQAIEARTRGLVGPITLLEGPATWPLIELEAETLTAPACALMGEAAHVLSPIGAQGMNLSLRDAGVLAGCLARARHVGLPASDGATLNHYAKARQPDMWRRHKGVSLLHQAVSSRSGVWRQLRHIGLQAIDAPVPPLLMLRHALMREALAPRQPEIDWLDMYQHRLGMTSHP